MKVRKGKEIIQANENGKKTGVVILLSNKVGFKIKSVVKGR